jgi:hypothetical protein
MGTGSPENFAVVAKLVDALSSGGSAARRESSNLFNRTAKRPTCKGRAFLFSGLLKPNQSAT